MSRWTRVAALAIAVMMALPGLANAQTAKIGFVNVGRLLSESPQAKAAMESLQEEL